jgi:predicted Zn-dependent peptidase
MSASIRVVLKIVICALTLQAMAAASYAGHTRINAPNSADPMNVHIYQLDNGLTVYLTENHETPRFYAEIAVRAGSKHDPAEATGLAHYLEHMLFKGNRNIGTLDYEKERVHNERIIELYEQYYQETDPEKRAEIYGAINAESQQAAQYVIPNELDKIYSSMGGTAVNAHTWHEETVYKVNLPANRLEQWAVIESDRFQNPVFRLFQTELETVYEEKNRTLDNKGRLINTAVVEQLFKVHPYGQQPTIGKVEHLKNPSLKRMYNFFETYYVPNNMAIFISGDIDLSNTIALIDQHFSGWQSKPLPEEKTWEEPSLNGVERVEVQYLGEEYAMLAFRTVAQSHQDAEALQLVDMVLDNATAGLINLNLNQQQRVRRAGSSPPMYNDHGYQTLWGIPKQGQTLQEVEQLLIDQLEMVKKGEFEDWIIPAIVNDFKKDQKAGLESNGSRVSWMRGAFLGYEDWDHTIASLDRMAMVTKDDLIRVANQYFGADYVAGYRLNGQHDVPQIEKPPIEKIAIDPTRESTFFRDIMSRPVDTIEPVFVNPETDYQIKSYRDDVPLYYAKNPLNDLFTLSITFDIGRYYQDKLGAAAMFLNRSGSSEYSAEELQKEWYKLGTSFNFGAGTYQSTISISGLDENFDTSLALMMDYVQNPSASQDKLDELIKIILANREDAKKNAQSINQAVIQYNRFGKSSQYLRMTPNEEVQKATVEELHGMVRDLFKYKHTIAYTGTLPIEQVLNTLEKHHPITAVMQDVPPYPFLKARKPAETEILFFHKEMAQAQIRIEFGGENYNEAQRAAVQFYNNYFGGDMSSIVFQELREARALAYSANAQYATGGRIGDQDLMIGVIGTQADKSPEAIGAFLELIENLPQSPERFAAVQNAILNRYRTSKLGFRSVLGAVRSWERLELPVDPRKESYEKIQAGDMDLMLKFHTEKIKGQSKLISIVGDKNKMDMDLLAKYGKVIEVSLEDVFVF